MKLAKIASVFGIMLALAVGSSTGVVLLGQPNAEAQAGSGVTVIIPSTTQQGTYIVGCANGTVAATPTPRLYESRRVC